MGGLRPRTGILDVGLTSMAIRTFKSNHVTFPLKSVCGSQLILVEAPARPVVLLTTHPPQGRPWALSSLPFPLFPLHSPTPS